MKSAKRIFNLATFKRPEIVIRMLASIIGQADVINCAVNYETGDRSSAFYIRDKIESAYGKDIVNVFMLDNSIFGDCAKFYELPYSDGYFFSVDDDLYYPKDYADRMIKKYEELGGSSIVALHGRNFHSWPITSYYNSPFTKYRVLGNVDKDVRVEFAGTCTTMWHTDLLRFDTDYITDINMGDIWLSYFAKQKNVPITVMAHHATWVDYLLKPDDDTIFVQYQKNHDIQTRLANLIYG